MAPPDPAWPTTADALVEEKLTHHDAHATSPTECWSRSGRRLARVDRFRAPLSYNSLDQGAIQVSETVTRRAVSTAIPLQGEHITLSQALKVAGLADTGGQAKVIVRAGQVTVNGEPELRPGRKLRAGDVICNTRGGQEWVIRA